MRKFSQCLCCPFCPFDLCSPSSHIPITIFPNDIWYAMHKSVPGIVYVLPSMQGKGMNGNIGHMLKVMMLKIGLIDMEQPARGEANYPQACQHQFLWPTGVPWFEGSTLALGVLSGFLAELCICCKYCMKVAFFVMKE